MSILCDVYKTKSKQDLYLFVTKEEGLSRVPDALLAEFKEPELALSLELTADRSLAREDAVKVMENLVSQGYYLQLPPPQFEAPSLLGSGEAQPKGEVLR